MEFFLFFWIGIGIVFAENHVWEKVELRVLPTPGIHCPTALTSTRQWINRSQFVLVQALAFNSSLATILYSCEMLHKFSHVVQADESHASQCHLLYLGSRPSLCKCLRYFASSEVDWQGIHRSP